MAALRAASLILLSLLAVVLASPQQYCVEDSDSSTDFCLALASHTNSTTGKGDLALHMSVKFANPAAGWASFGLGEKMNGALMFLMYAGETKDAKNWQMPQTLVQSQSAGPEVNILRRWVSHHGTHNAQVMCYDCESWTSSESSLMSSNLTWIWAINYSQDTASNAVDMFLARHAYVGRFYMDMASAYSTSKTFRMPQVSSHRVQGNFEIPESGTSSLDSPAKVPSPPPGPAPSPAPHNTPINHTHKAFGVVSIHGFLLSSGFLVLSIGVLAIRSGLTSSFKFHWLIQTIAGAFIVLGYLLGIYISFKHGGKFNHVHQWIGLLVIPAVTAQGLLGYYHHKNFVKYSSRTTVSYWHIWLGRAIVFVGNINILLGLVLSEASMTKFYFCFLNFALQLSVLGPMWYFWSKGQTVKDVVTKGELSEGYQSVEQEAFILENSEDDEEEATRREDVNLKDFGRES